MRSRLFLLIITLLEVFTLFCLGVLGDRIANLIQIRTSLLLSLTAFAVALTTIISFLRQSPPDIDSNLTFREVWQRLKPKKRRRPLFGPRYTDKQETALTALGLIGPFILGVIGAFLRIPFIEAGLSKLWFWLLAVFLLLALIPMLLLERRTYSLDTWSDSFLGIGCLSIFLTTLILSGVALGFIVIYFLNNSFKFI